MISVTYRTTSSGEWSGIGVDLTAAQVDRNFYNVATKLQELEDSRPQPNNIASITVSGTYMTVFLDDATAIGPLPLPVLQFRWRGEWEPTTLYSPLDALIVPGVGLYSVLEEHFSGATFDEAAVNDDDDPLYNKLFGADAGAAAAALDYDMGFSWQGVLKDSLDDILWEAVLPRRVVLHQEATHRVYLHEAPTTAQQVLPIWYDDDEVGRATVEVGENAGVVVLDADVTIEAGQRLAVGKPGTDDASAAMLSMMFLARRAT